MQVFNYTTGSVSLKVWNISKYQAEKERTLSQDESTKEYRASPHQQVVSAASCKDFRYSPLPPSDDRHELEDDSVVLLHLVNQAQIDQDL